jgi:ATP-dependent helicase/nuclease subunit B
MSKITVPDSGKILHAVIERFCKIGNFNDLSVIPAITHQVLEEELSETLRQNPRFSSFSRKIIATLEITLKNIAEFYKNTNFEPFSFEAELPPFEIKLENGEIITLRGRVDRVDICRNANGNFISVVDYKSSQKTIDEADIACGVQVQLPAYIHALCESYSKQENVTFFPASMLYYKIDSPNISSTTNEEVWEEIQKELRMRGIMLDIMEENKKFVMKNTATLEEINNLCNTALTQIKKQLSEISKGAISLAPYRRLGSSGACACDFCDYHAVCKFDTSKNGNKYNVVKKR